METIDPGHAETLTRGERSELDLVTVENQSNKHTNLVKKIEVHNHINKVPWLWKGSSGPQEERSQTNLTGAPEEMGSSEDRS